MKGSHPAPLRSGLTLIELIAVIAIVGILATVLIPAIAAVRQRSERTLGASNVRSIGNAVFLYANDNNGSLPGSLNEGQSGYYKEYDGSLASYVASYLGCKPYVSGPALPCSYFFRREPPGGASANHRYYAMNMRVSFDDGITYVAPFGRAANSSTRPLRLSELGTLGQLSSLVMMQGLDRFNAHLSGQTGVDWDPPYNDVRFTLYFDGRVEMQEVTINQTNSDT